MTSQRPRPVRSSIHARFEGDRHPRVMAKELISPWSPGPAELPPSRGRVAGSASSVAENVGTVLALLPLLGWVAVACPVGGSMAMASDTCGHQGTARICTAAGQNLVAMLPGVSAGAGLLLALGGCIVRGGPARTAMFTVAYLIAFLGYAWASSIASGAP